MALYTLYDATRCFDFFGRITHYQRAIKVAPGITATFYDARHILGSASISLDLKERIKTCRITFSGDLGSKAKPRSEQKIVKAGLAVGLELRSISYYLPTKAKEKSTRFSPGLLLDFSSLNEQEIHENSLKLRDVFRSKPC